MIRSMTGYGQGQVALEGRRLEVEIRSVNHKFSEISVKLPKALVFLEPDLKKQLQQRFPRGRLDLLVTLNGTPDYSRRLEVDIEMGRQYRSALQELKTQLKLEGEIDLAMLTNCRNLISVEEKPLESRHLTRVFFRVFGQAANGLEGMRQREGRALAVDLKRRLGRIAKSLGIIKRRAPKVVTEYRTRLNLRIKSLTEGSQLNPQRLEQEVALYAARCDISEEVTRIEAHLAQFRSMINVTRAVGRTMDFLIQELHREINTTGSKANDSEISRQVISIKSELERLREQAQNVQ